MACVPLLPAQSRTEIANRAKRSTLVGIALNIALAAIKFVAGTLGHSYALIADAIESATDIFSSLVVLVGVEASSLPPDESHPQGHGKFEVLAAATVSLLLFGAAGSIAIESVHQIETPHRLPAPFTLIVLVGVILVKEALFRFVQGVGKETHSAAVRSDAWHHRADAVTSIAAFIGISVALMGGKGYESADSWAALFAAGIIGLNAFKLLQSAFEELTDKSPGLGVERMVRDSAMTVSGVLGTHRCFVRKVGFDYLVELDIEVQRDLTVAQGHAIAHEVRIALRRQSPSILRVFVHVEPFEEPDRPMKEGEDRYT